MNQTEHDAICRNLVDRGFIIEAGFVALRFVAIDPQAPQLQVDEMRLAFFAGSQHLFASIMSILEPGAEPTESDLARLNLIGQELDAFGDEIKARFDVEIKPQP